MKEDILHYIWQHGKLSQQNLVTTTNESILIKELGQPNEFSGPDFYNAKIRIGNQLWFGNVEIHIKASDWYAHGHEKDPKYDQVILHVVWENNTGVSRQNNMMIPTLELKNYISNETLKQFSDLLDVPHKNFINCERDLSKVKRIIVMNWLGRMYMERLEQKSILIHQLLHFFNNNWEHVLFILLLKSFGSKINGDVFFMLGKSFSFTTIQKLSSDPIALETILLGTAGLLDEPSIEDPYLTHLNKEYNFLKKKYLIPEVIIPRPEFFKLRPSNFPTIRLSQISRLYAYHPHLFSEIVQHNDPSYYYERFKVSAGAYWDDHYIFGKKSRKQVKFLSKKFIDLLIINTIIPIKYCYAKFHGQEISDMLENLLRNIAPENNGTVKSFSQLKIPCEDALHSQAMIQLYTAYCKPNKCLECAIGNHLLKGK